MLDSTALVLVIEQRFGIALQGPVLSQHSQKEHILLGFESGPGSHAEKYLVVDVDVDDPQQDSQDVAEGAEQGRGRAGELEQEPQSARGGGRGTAGAQELIQEEQGTLCGHQRPDPPAEQPGLPDCPVGPGLCGQEGDQIRLQGHTAEQDTAHLSVGHEQHPRQGRGCTKTPQKQLRKQAEQDQDVSLGQAGDEDCGGLGGDLGRVQQDHGVGAAQQPQQGADSVGGGQDQVLDVFQCQVSSEIFHVVSLH